ncbi:hypothetical protein OH76DRAFT_1028418 [Lentinus brumalis]|uniref:DUF6534 domain-containing protein n=1 Tax=Lentinus brumalis TaxID=2498619 RepID=A0A371CXU1_9APHY|nr:hypothetical protein OH76DRAFT_1028418 [Polyporus brumalis]
MSAPLVEPDVPQATLLLVGPVFLGAITSWLIFGISIVQLYIYTMNFPHDRKGLQVLVYWVFILDIFLTVVAAAMGWHILCAGWGRQTNLVTPGWTFAAIGAGDGIIATTVQIFYAWRIWVLKRWRILPCVIIVISLAQLGSTLSIAAGIANLQNISELLPFFPRTILWLGGGALADILIACAMVYLLTTAKKNSHALKSSDRAINRLIRLSVETGIITACSAIIELGLFLGPATENTNLHLFFALILGKIYSNTMMTSLNSRINTQQTMSRPPTDVTSGVSITHPHNFRAGNASVRTGGPAAPVVHIASHTEVFADDHYSQDSDNKNQTLADDMEMMERKPRNNQFHSFSPV